MALPDDHDPPAAAAELQVLGRADGCPRVCCATNVVLLIVIVKEVQISHKSGKSKSIDKNDGRLSCLGRFAQCSARIVACCHHGSASMGL